MTEKDLCDIREAVGVDDTSRAIEATEIVLDGMGYIRRTQLLQEGYFQAVPFHS